LKNYTLSDDIAFRFSNKGWSEYPLTTEKYVSWLNKVDKKEETVNLFMDYETFGEHQWAETGIFEFLKNLPDAVFKLSKYSFSTPSEVARNLQPVSAINVTFPISWADEERDLTAWLGNEMQQEAFNKLYELSNKISRVNDPKLEKDWNYLQVSDHFYYMCTKFFSDGAVHSYFNPYQSPYDAFINYMNILNDFIIRVDAAVPETDKEQEIANLTSIINEKDAQIAKYTAEIDRLIAGISVLATNTIIEPSVKTKGSRRGRPPGKTKKSETAVIPSAKLKASSGERNKTKKKSTTRE
jgi:alpha-amylase